MSAETTKTDRPAPSRSRLLHHDLDPVEMGRKSGEARREKRRRREAAAAWDSLTVQARLALVLASRLSFHDLDELTAAAIKRALGDGHVANAAYAQLMAMAAAAVASTDADSVEDSDPATWTPEQRAAYRARLDSALEAMRDEQVEQEESEEQAQSGEQA